MVTKKPVKKKVVPKQKVAPAPLAKPKKLRLRRW